MASSSPSASTPSRRSAVGHGVARLMRTPAKIMVPRLLFIVAVVLLCAVGLVAVYSASSVQAYSDTGDPAFYVRRQAVFLLVGIASCVLFARVPYTLWSHPFLFVGMWVITTLLLVATQIGFGTRALGAERSIVIGSMALQPAELAKITTVYAACCLVVMQRTGRLELKHFMVAIVVVIGVPTLLIFRQPDLGTVIILFVGLLAAAILAGLSWKIVFMGIGVIVAYAVLVCIVQPYHLERLKTLFDPWSDPGGTGYQTIQSLYALALGGTGGAGLGMSQEKYLYLPYAHTDFIFAVIGEEFGLVGTISIVALFVLFTYAGIRICRNAPDMLGCALAGSLTVMVAFQACVNMGCVIGLLPVTGKALPFLSYGGSSLVATLSMVGLVLSVSLSSRVNAQSEKRRAALHVVGAAPEGEGGQRRASSGSHGGGGRVRGDAAAHGEKARGHAGASSRPASLSRAREKKARGLADAQRQRGREERRADGRRARRDRGGQAERREEGRRTRSSRQRGREAGRGSSGGASRGGASRAGASRDGAPCDDARRNVERNRGARPARGYSRKGR